MLLSIEALRKALDEEFLPLEPGMAGMRLVPGGLTPGQVRELATQINGAVGAESHRFWRHL